MGCAVHGNRPPSSGGTRLIRPIVAGPCSIAAGLVRRPSAGSTTERTPRPSWLAADAGRFAVTASSLRITTACSPPKAVCVPSAFVPRPMGDGCTLTTITRRVGFEVCCATTATEGSAYFRTIQFGSVERSSTYGRSELCYTVSGGREAPPRKGRVAFKTLTARFAGTCRRCAKAGLDGSFDAGTKIRWAKGAGSYHLAAECPASDRVLVSVGGGRGRCEDAPACGHSDCGFGPGVPGYGSYVGGSPYYGEIEVGA